MFFQDSFLSNNEFDNVNRSIVQKNFFFQLSNYFKM